MGILALHNEVKEQVAQGVAKEDILQKLVKKKDEHPGKFAYVIASVAAPPIAEKNLAVNVLLLFFLLCSAVLTFWTALPIDPDASTFFLFMKILFPLMFLYYVFAFFGGIYRIMGWWFCIDLLEALTQFQQDGLAVSLRVIVLFLLVVLSFYQGRSLFPHMGLLRPGKNERGDFLL